MNTLKDWKNVIKNFINEEENKNLINNDRFKDLFIKAIEEGIPFDILAELLIKANLNVDIQQIKNELYLLAIKILKN